jgi:hypothetical protein
MRMCVGGTGPTMEYVLPDVASIAHMVHSAMTMPLMPVDTNAPRTVMGCFTAEKKKNKSTMHTKKSEHQSILPRHTSRAGQA